eukprot:2265192-Pyramimonas_sp.AAC.1
MNCAETLRNGGSTEKSITASSSSPHSACRCTSSENDGVLFALHKQRTSPHHQKPIQRGRRMGGSRTKTTRKEISMNGVVTCRGPQQLSTHSPGYDVALHELLERTTNS